MIDLKTIKSLSREASPAPWTAETKQGVGVILDSVGNQIFISCGEEESPELLVDKHLIVAIRNALPEIIEKLEHK